MYRQCTTERASLQQAEFEACLLASMKHRAYHEITVSMLCQKTGLSRKVFYRLFGSKDDALCALVDHNLLKFENYVMPCTNPAPMVPDELVRFFFYWKEQQPMVDALRENHRSSLLIERSIWYISQEQANTMRWIGAAESQESRRILLFFISGLMGLVIDWNQSGYRDSIEEISAAAFQLLSNPPLRLPIPQQYR